MKASEKSYRLYICGRCAQQVRICRDCDRGNRYCAHGCAQIRRDESLRRAAERYQQSYGGACKHAARQIGWRLRHAYKVTHQGSQPSAVALIVVPTSTATPMEAPYANTASVKPQPHTAALEARLSIRRKRWPLRHAGSAEPRCCFCGCVLSDFARLGPLRAGP